MMLFAFVLFSAGFVLLGVARILYYKDLEGQIKVLRTHLGDVQNELMWMRESNN